jgi:hypothetical protein
MEFYAAMKKNEMLSFAGKWMELENIILTIFKNKNKSFLSRENVLILITSI